jgi:hypothetical protein
MMSPFCRAWGHRCPVESEARTSSCTMAKGGGESTTLPAGFCWKDSS